MDRKVSNSTMEGAEVGVGPEIPEGKTVDMDQDGLFTVTRNKPVDLDSKLLALIKAGKPKKDVDELIAKMKPKWDYSGVYSKNLVSHTIRVTHLGFYGPFEKEEADYNVHVQVFAPKKAKKVYPQTSSRPIAEIRAKISGKKQKIFYAEFTHPVFIEPTIWYLIDFKLDGPPTLRCLETESNIQVPAGDTNINFEFGEGSKQMPCMCFKLA